MTGWNESSLEGKWLELKYTAWTEKVDQEYTSSFNTKSQDYYWQLDGKEQGPGCDLSFGILAWIGASVQTLLSILTFANFLLSYSMFDIRPHWAHNHSCQVAVVCEKKPHQCSNESYLSWLVLCIFVCLLSQIKTIKDNYVPVQLFNKITWQVCRI